MALLLAWPQFTSDPLDALIDQFLDETGLPGAVVAIGYPGNQPELRAYGFADAVAGVPMTTEDRLKIASLSKPITAEAILTLIRRGLLDLDTPLLDLQPIVTGAADGSMSRITVRHLLQHSGGWDRAKTFDPFFLRERDLSILTDIDARIVQSCEPVADAFLKQPTQFEPGDRYAYSNIGYCWLGRILARLHNSSYEEAVHALLPETSGMTLDPSDLTVRHHAYGREEEYLVNRPGIIAAAGGWIAGAKDYFRFASRSVDPLILERPVYATGTQFYGLGWRVWEIDDGVVLTHYGAMPGVFSVVFKKLNGPIFVALFNGRPRDDWRAFLDLFEDIRNLSFWSR